MAQRTHSSLLRAAAALGFILALAGCTKGGQFDPTEMFNSDVFDSKTKLKGDRVPLFPNGVPGTETGVPPDLVKGYQPPPEQADAGTIPPAPSEAVKPETKPKPKPKPKVAVARPPKQPVEVAPAGGPASTRIDIGARSGTPAQPQATPSVWPNATPAPAPAQQAGQFAWPAPPQTGAAQQAPQQAAQPSQSVWPNPPPTGQSSQ
jgi:hypothetical protein